MQEKGLFCKGALVKAVEIRGNGNKSTNHINRPLKPDEGAFVQEKADIKDADGSSQCDGTSSQSDGFVAWSTGKQNETRGR